MEERPQYQRPQLLGVLFLYTLWALGGAAVFSDQAAVGWIRVVMLGFVVLCMPAGKSTTWRRIAYVPLAWLLHGFLASIPALLFTEDFFGPISGPRRALLVIGSNLVAGMPFVAFALRGTWLAGAPSRKTALPEGPKRSNGRSAMIENPDPDGRLRPTGLIFVL